MQGEHNVDGVHDEGAERPAALDIEALPRLRERPAPEEHDHRVPGRHHLQPQPASRRAQGRRSAAEAADEGRHGTVEDRRAPAADHAIGGYAPPVARSAIVGRQRHTRNNSTDGFGRRFEG